MRLVICERLRLERTCGAVKRDLAVCGVTRGEVVGTEIPKSCRVVQSGRLNAKERDEVQIADGMGKLAVDRESSKVRILRL